MKPASTTTLVVEPDHNGHHLQSVSWIARHAHPWGPVVVLTNREAPTSPELEAYLAEDVEAGRVVLEPVFDGIKPSIEEQARVVGEYCRDAGESPVARVLHMDADQALKHWWRVAPRALRGLATRPQVTFMLTRYPARLALTDLTGWRLRVPKAVLAVVARLRGVLDRTVGYAGRDDDARGWIVRRVQDPAFCTAHSRDAARWRQEYDLPADRRLVGVFGVIYERKNVPMLLEALEHAGVDADILLAGALSDGVREWIDGLAPERRARLIVRDAYLSNEQLDRMVAAMDVVPLALTNNGPSGIMGKAEAAGVPIVTAGSTVRAREMEALGAGVACELTVEALGQAMKQVLEGRVTIRTGQEDRWAAVDRYTEVLLGPASARVDEKR